MKKRVWRPRARRWLRSSGANRRPPIYRDGDRYALDPHDAEADLWAFRLGLRPRSGAAVRVRDDGRWDLDRTHDAVRSARVAVRERIAMVRRWAEMRPDPAVIEANQRRIEREREAHGEHLAGLRRVLIHAFPAVRPEAVVLVDVAERKITTYIGQEIAQAIHRLADDDIIGAVGVRALLRALNVEAGERRLAKLGPAQRTRRLNKRGRTLTITTTATRSGLVRHQPSVRR